LAIRYEWDAGKNASNRKKHGIDFETARLAFDDPFSISFPEKAEGGEERWHAIGMVENVVVVHTYQADGSEELVRIISARRATSHERKLYAEAHR
jgi:uncharacterized DUF497 family protein